MDYTNLSNQVVFLRDADIVNDMSAKTISGNIVLSNGIPSYDLFTLKHSETNADINFLSNELSVSIRRDLSSVRYFGTVHLSDKYDHEEIAQLTGNTLFGLLKTNMYINKPDKELRAGFTFRAVGNEISDFIVSSDNATSACLLHDNDYLILNKNIEHLSNVSINDIDIVKDYDLSVYRLQNLIISTNNNIAELTEQVVFLSSELSNNAFVHEIDYSAVSSINDIAEYIKQTKLIEKWNTDDIIIVKRHIFRSGSGTELDDKCEHTAYVFDAKNGSWYAMDGNYSSDNILISKDMILAGKWTRIGNVTKTSEASMETLQAKGLTLTEMFEKILKGTELFPAKASDNKPTCTISLNSRTAEVGTPVIPTFTLSYNGRSYTYGTNTKPDSTETGVKANTYNISYTVNGTAQTFSGTWTTSASHTEFRVVNGPNIAGGQLTCNYVAAADGTYIPMTNFKRILSEPDELDMYRIKSGAVTASNTQNSITGYYGYFYGYKTSKAIVPSAITSALIRALGSGAATGFPVTYTTTNMQQMFFACKEGYASKLVIKNKAGQESLTVYTLHNVQVNDAAGTPVSYTVFYVDNASPESGATTHTLEFS